MPSITINFTQAQADRMAPAFQKILGLANPATGADIKTFIVRAIQRSVLVAEAEIAEEARQAADMPPEIT